ncbi:formylglycine-generating enzyme family protein [Magnetococcales bacterium HHB-1]
MIHTVENSALKWNRVYGSNGLNCLTLCGRAELIRVLALEDEKTVQALANKLGYTVKKRDPQLKSEPTLTLEHQPTLEPDLAGASKDIPPTPFWQLNKHETLKQEIIKQTSTTSKHSSEIRKAGEVNGVKPKLQPLSPWKALEPQLRRHLRRAQPGLKPDIHRLVHLLARGEYFTALPREKQRYWSDIHIILDRSHHMVPYWDDQDWLCSQLFRQLWDKIKIGHYHEAMDEPCGRDGSKLFDHLSSGSSVLILGDLGILESRKNKDLKRWLRLGKKLKRHHVNGVVLFPGPLSRVPHCLKSIWKIIEWERVTNLLTENRSQQTERLLRLISPAIRIEPGFLREIRRLLGTDQADASIEADIWKNPMMQGELCVAGVLDDQYRSKLQSEFEQKEKALHKQVIDILIKWRDYLPREILFEEIIKLGAIGKEHQAKLQAEAQQFFMAWSEEIEEDIQKGEINVKAHHWFRRVARRDHKHLWCDPIVGKRLRKINHLIRRKDSDYTPASGFQPKQIKARPEQSPTPVTLYHQSDQLIFRAGSSPDGKEGSPLASLITTNRLLLITETAKEHPPRTRQIDLSKDETVEPLSYHHSFQVESDCHRLSFTQMIKPKWAEAIGRDRFGLWARIIIDEKQDITLTLRWIPGGIFLMGSPENEKDRFDREGPQHEVELDGFWLGKYPVTQKLWKAVIGDNPSRFKDDDHPVEKVSWNDTQTLIKKLNHKINEGFRLPSEAEWEYACRAGTTTPFWTGEDISTDQANYDGNYPYRGKKGEYREKTTPVDLFSANPFGLHDMHGNVWEWCQDIYAKDAYKHHARKNPIYEGGTYRVLRGGSWIYGAGYLRCAGRDGFTPEYRDPDTGFRLAFAPRTP